MLWFKPQDMSTSGVFSHRKGSIRTFFKRTNMEKPKSFKPISKEAEVAKNPNFRHKAGT